MVLQHHKKCLNATSKISYDSHFKSVRKTFTLVFPSATNCLNGEAHVESLGGSFKCSCRLSECFPRKLRTSTGMNSGEPSGGICEKRVNLQLSRLAIAHPSTIPD